MKTKREVLIENHWEPMIGYCFPTPCAEEDMLTFVEKEECEKVFAEGPKEYFWNDSHDRLFELEEAWDYFLDDYYELHNKNFEEEVRS